MEPEWPQEQVAAEHDRVCSVHILFGTTVVVSRSNGSVGGKLAVIADLRSVASLQVFGRGVGSIGALFEVSSLFCSSLSPDSPPLTVLPLSLLPYQLSLVFCSL